MGSPTVLASGCRSLGAVCRCITRGASDKARRFWSPPGHFSVAERSLISATASYTKGRRFSSDGGASDDAGSSRVWKPCREHACIGAMHKSRSFWSPKGRLFVARWSLFSATADQWRSLRENASICARLRPAAILTELGSQVCDPSGEAVRVDVHDGFHGDHLPGWHSAGCRPEARCYGACGCLAGAPAPPERSIHPAVQGFVRLSLASSHASSGPRSGWANTRERHVR
jgi:hypothetical protein